MVSSSHKLYLVQAVYCISKKYGTPLRGIEPRPRRWKRRILATRPQGIWQVEIWQLFVFSIIMTHFFVMELNDVLSNFHEIHDYVKICCTPLRGIEPRPRRWKRRILATRPQGMVTYVCGKSRLLLVWWKLVWQGFWSVWRLLMYIIKLPYFINGFVKHQ